MFRESTDVKLSDGKEMWPFEFSVFLCINQYVIKVVCIHRPPHSEAHPIFTKAFFADFSLYLESIVLATEIPLITGDFNLHVDCPLDRNAKRFSELLDTFGLIQHVNVPTHSSGYILHLNKITQRYQFVISSVLQCPIWQFLCRVYVENPAPSPSSWHGPFSQIQEH